MIRAWLLAVFCLTSSVLLGGCDSKPPENPLADAARMSAKRESVAYEGAMAGRENFRGAFRGSIEFQKRRASHVLVDGDFTAEEVVDGSHVFFRNTTNYLNWEYIDQVDGDKSSTQRVFEYLRRADGVAQSGQEIVRGVIAIRYDFGLETKYAISAGGLPEASAQFFEPSSRGTGWVDDDGLLRRLEFSATPLDPGEPTLEWHVEYFDYDEAPPVVIPDVPTTKPTGGRVDSFDGVACFGARVAECLAPNPELATLAQDYTLCTGWEERICLVPVGNVPLEVVQTIVEFHRRTRDLEIVILPSVPVAAGMVNSDSQVTQWDIINLVRSAYAVGDETPSTFIAITPFDMQPEGMDEYWMLGERFERGALGSIDAAMSIFRLANVQPAGKQTVSEADLLLRATRYFARLVALAFDGLPEQKDRNLLNYEFAEDIDVLDAMGEGWPEIP